MTARDLVRGADDASVQAAAREQGRAVTAEADIAVGILDRLLSLAEGGDVKAAAVALELLADAGAADDRKRLFAPVQRHVHRLALGIVDDPGPASADERETQVVRLLALLEHVFPEQFNTDS